MIMKSLRQRSKLFLCLPLLIVIGCTHNNETPKADTQNSQVEQVIPHKTSLTGSLVTDSENTPDQFFKMTINDRPQFTDKRNQVNGHLEQVISNPDQSFIIVAIWENINEKWRCMGIIISQNKQITPDEIQVLLRIPYRLTDSSTIRNAFHNNITYTRLSNGAGLSIKQDQERTTYEIY